ncbi:hypothetical protein PCCS19_12570 [Paenibacillus sp. CCS19]|uniref:hypothetical protein n=1 Tax=Paenibacillus sp. CCS19 TaxID=3158387 RepID=UPI00256CFB8C|nr:hypothetical protein [Paenibacillus cellulosilyticus]GMK38203.1 hypothetical protein PCCS19_12570 [Paenibacillus cellulosilyticus]
MNLSKTHIVVIVVVAALMLLFDWRGLKDVRTKTAYFILYIPGFTLAILLVINPSLPGPVQWMRPLFAPLAKLLFKS